MRLKKVPWIHPVSSSSIIILREMWIWHTILQQMLCSMQKSKYSNCIIFVFEDAFFKPMKVKGDGFCLFKVSASHLMSCFLDDVWTDRFPHGKKPGIIGNIWGGEWFESIHLPERQWSTSKRFWHICRLWSQWIQRKDRWMGFCNGIHINEQGALLFWW